jgi:hypothetical protein
MSTTKEWRKSLQTWYIPVLHIVLPHICPLFGRHRQPDIPLTLKLAVTGSLQERLLVEVLVRALLVGI